MTDHQVSQRILTIPNIITFLRLAGVPVFWWALLVERSVSLAAVLLIVIGGTDWVDGYLARRLNQVSKLGTTLDPVADRLVIASAIVGGLIAAVIPVGIGLPLIARELFVGGITLVLVSRGAAMLQVRYLGKLATFILYGAIPAFYLAEAGVAAPVTRPLAWVAGLVGLVIYWLVAFQYVGDARRALADVESPPSPEES